MQFPEEAPHGQDILRNLPVQPQLSESEKTVEFGADSSVRQHSENRPRSSTVLCPDSVATQDHQAASAVPLQSEAHSPPDIMLLYWTLVSDKAVPSGFEKEFATLEAPIQRAAAAELRRSTKMTDMYSAVCLHRRVEKQNFESRRKKLSEDQFLLAAQTRPTRFKARWQESYFDGPTARRDAEDALRCKWVEALASILRGTPTPMGQLLNKSSDNMVLLGGGRRATTLRARGRAVKKYIAWLSLSHEIVFPSEVQHLSEYLQMRHSEPCTRGGLKSTHQALVFLEDVAAVETKLTQSPLYSTIYKELLSSTLTKGNQRQAPRFPTVMVQALEDTVIDESARPYFRVYAWWLLLQCWATLRFSDHRGLIPDEGFEVKGNMLSTRLQRSKTIGSDKTVTSRSVVVSPACFAKRAQWLSCGWALLKQHADYPRDYLLPMPSGNYKGCVRRELRYDTAHALQVKVLQSLRTRGEPLLSPQTAQYRTPHSGRNFLVSAASAIGVPKPDRDMLGGWAAQQSDRYIRVSRSRIMHVQTQVITALTSQDDPDPLCEEETLQDFSAFLETRVSEEEKKRCLNLLGRRAFVTQPRETQTAPEEQTEVLVQFPSEQLLLEEQEHEQQLAAKAEIRKKQQAWNDERTAKLGPNPREYRRQLRESLDQGFYVAVSSKKKIRTLHLLGECYMLPTLDYTTFTFLGSQLPSRNLYDQTCKWCAKSGDTKHKSTASSDCGTATSSSTEDAQE